MDVKTMICAKSTYWWVTAAERHFRMLFVTVGPKPELGENSSKSFFQIKKTGVLVNGYTIAFCSNDNGCKDVGIFMDEHGIRRLVLGSIPFPIMFMKVTEEDTLSII
ncbi:kunitz trypsin inhibitor 1 [Raphanus sativus]|nr:kunitz trypsin inhibitor 1 [Raphanus sativus]